MKRQHDLADALVGASDRMTAFGRAIYANFQYRRRYRRELPRGSNAAGRRRFRRKHGYEPTATKPKPRLWGKL